MRSSCGFRLAPKLDISVSGGADPLRPAERTDAAHVLMVVSSVVPYALGVVLLACHGRSSNRLDRRLTGRPILEGKLPFLRFTYSCSTRKWVPPIRGRWMAPSPSFCPGHACTSIGTLTFLLLETWVEGGERLREPEGLAESRARAIAALSALPENLRSLEPMREPAYAVTISTGVEALVATVAAKVGAEPADEEAVL